MCAIAQRSITHGFRRTCNWPTFRFRVGFIKEIIPQVAKAQITFYNMRYSWARRDVIMHYHVVAHIVVLYGCEFQLLREDEIQWLPL